MRIIGYAVRWDDHAVIDGRRERFAPGAFSKALSLGCSPVLNYDHDARKILAVEGFGSIDVREDDRGLRVEAEIRQAPSIDLSPIRSGAMNGLSLEFEAHRERMIDGVRVVYEASPNGIAVVQWPAYRQSRFIVCSGSDMREADGLKEKYRIRLAVEREKLAAVV